MTSEKTDQLWTVVILQDKLFALPVEDVETMVTLPPVSAVPNMPEHVRGVINLRGKVMPVVDLRKRLGMPTLQMETDSLVDMLSQREKEHLNWIEELQASITESRKFTSLLILICVHSVSGMIPSKLKI